LLAQIDVKTTAEGLGSNFLPWALVLVLVALGFVVRHTIEAGRQHAAALEALQKAKDAEVAALQKTLLETVKSDAEEQRKLLMTVMPLSTKLLEMLELTKEESE
jgi:cell division protein FtsB